MKITAILSILLCFAFVISLALTGCRKKNDPYFMDSSEYNSLISGITGVNGDKAPSSDENFGEVTNPPAGDEDGDEVDDSSSKKPSSKPATGSSSSKNPTSTSKPDSSTGTSIPTGGSSSEDKESSSSTPVSSSSKQQSGSIGTSRPSGAIGGIIK